MCGIIGFFSRLNRNTIDVNRLAKMRDTMAHRGPDDAGIRLFDQGRVGLAHRRLSIIDVSPTGREPMSSRDGRYWLTFNGEIYNFIELRAELISKGYVFYSSCDAEVILAAYTFWGTECVNRFNGMWAFAIWDTREKTLFCSRDRFGIKPFFYCDDGQLFIFSSEIRAILASGHMSPEPRVESMATYLDSRLVDGRETTFFERVFRLRAAHSLLVTQGETKIWRYWDIHVAPENPKGSPADMARVRASLEEAVRSHMVSDVPVGVSLSGGLDSSSIFALASRIGKERLSVFSTYFEDASTYDERYYFNKIADAYGAEKYSVLPGRDQLFNLLPKIIWHLEEPPFAHGVYPRWHIMDLASDHVKVLLIGQGADEIFAGYTGYYSPFFRDCLRLGGYLRLSRELLLNRHNLKRIPALAFSRMQSMLGRLGHTMRRNPDHHPGTAFSAAGEGLLGRCSKPGAHDGRDVGASRLNEQLYYDTVYGSLPTLLKYDDKIGMAFSIECRVPFLDHRLVELLFSLSPFVKIQGGWTKSILRRAMDGILPPEVQWRAAKTAYPMPFGEWFRGMLFAEAEQRVMDSKLIHDHYLDRGKVETLLKGHRQGRYDLSGHIWQWICLSTWYDVHTKLTDRSLAARPSLA